MIKNITIGTFEVNSGRIVASDPCYNIDVWCQDSFPAINGKYFASIKRGDTQNGWGVRNYELMVIHEKYENEHNLIWESVDGGFYVDSGTFGFFDYDYYKQYHSGSEKNKEAENAWYHENICNRIYDNWNCDMDNSGVWSSSGYGDGGYEVFVAWEEDEVIGLKVIFIEEE